MFSRKSAINFLIEFCCAQVLLKVRIFERALFSSPVFERETNRQQKKVLKTFLGDDEYYFLFIPLWWGQAEFLPPKQTYLFFFWLWSRIFQYWAYSSFSKNEVKKINSSPRIYFQNCWLFDWNESNYPFQQKGCLVVKFWRYFPQPLIRPHIQYFQYVVFYIK